MTAPANVQRRMQLVLDLPRAAAVHRTLWSVYLFLRLPLTLTNNSSPHILPGMVVDQVNQASRFPYHLKNSIVLLSNCFRIQSFIPSLVDQQPPTTRKFNV